MGTPFTLCLQICTDKHQNTGTYLTLHLYYIYIYCVDIILIFNIYVSSVATLSCLDSSMCKVVFACLPFGCICWIFILIVVGHFDPVVTEDWSQKWRYCWKFFLFVCFLRVYFWNFSFYHHHGHSLCSFDLPAADGLIARGRYPGLFRSGIPYAPLGQLAQSFLLCQPERVCKGTPASGRS